MFSHLTPDNAPQMVDIAPKQVTKRIARARAVMVVGEEVLALLEESGGKEIITKKGAVFQTAILAGIMAAKKTGDLIPLCHTLPLEHCQIDITVNEAREIVIECSASLSAKTGVEMEALTGASVAALTVYDMCKALSQDMVIREIRLVEKSGGKSDILRA